MWRRRSVGCGRHATASEPVLFDTDVLIWVIRGHAGAIRKLDATRGRSMSAISWMELIQGSRNAQELKSLHAFQRTAEFRVIPLTENVGHRATVLLEQHALADGLHLTDALIAATAIELGESLCTADLRHFKKIKDLTLVPFKS